MVFKGGTLRGKYYIDGGKMLFATRPFSKVVIKVRKLFCRILIMTYYIYLLYYS